MKYITGFALYFLILSPISYAEIIDTVSIRTNSICGSSDTLMVISAVQIPALSGHQLKHLSLFHFSSAQQVLKQIVFQIDQRDVQGRYILHKKSKADSETSVAVFSDKDELVVRKKDLNGRIDHASALLKHTSLLELQVLDHSVETESKWLYIKLDSDNGGESQQNFKQSIVYDHEQDSTSSAIYTIGFAKEHPFLLDSFYWRRPNQTDLGSDLSDTMKIRHQGKFFGLPFKRTQADYYSQLVAVKEGPLRIIRRTENRIKVFWKLKSPALFIDYVMMPDGFIMATMIDIPFKIGYFFSDLATLTTMDWNPSADHLGLKVQGAKGSPAMLINGQPSVPKTALNDSLEHSFLLTSAKGDLKVTLTIPEDFPIKSNIYLVDDLSLLDPPENNPGQFGNIGFKTTGWENIDSRLYHLNFSVCIAPAK